MLSCIQVNFTVKENIIVILLPDSTTEFTCIYLCEQEPEFNIRDIYKVLPFWLQGLWYILTVIYNNCWYIFLTVLVITLTLICVVKMDWWPIYSAKDWNKFLCWIIDKISLFVQFLWPASSKWKNLVEKSILEAVIGNWSCYVRNLF